MRFVVQTGPGVVELNWMWLPTFIGLSTQAKTLLEQRLAPDYRNPDRRGSELRQTVNG